MTSKRASILFLAILTVFSSGRANPVLIPGTWVDITPQETLQSSEPMYICDLQVDPHNSSILYVCDVQGHGLQKSYDGGSTWRLLGANGGTQLKNAFRIRIDPNDSRRLYLIQGVRGAGFFVSNDSGATWTTPAGWTRLMDTIHEDDLYNIAVDPTDFNHLLISFYLGWNTTTWYVEGNAGVVESRDGANTWIVHQPRPEWSTDHCGNVAFLYDPVHGQGDRNTWIYSNRSSGIWRTTDAGNSWTQVSTLNIVRSQYYYSKTGVLYGAGMPYPIRSTDNGITWQSVTNGIQGWYYYAMQGDGNLLYTVPTGTTSPGPVFVSTETDGLTWHPFNSQTFLVGANGFTYDSAGKIMYMSAQQGGLWALKVDGQVTANIGAPSERTAGNSSLPNNLRFGRRGISLKSDAGVFYDIQGRMISGTVRLR